MKIICNNIQYLRTQYKIYIEYAKFNYWFL